MRLSYGRLLAILAAGFVLIATVTALAVAIGWWQSPYQARIRGLRDEYLAKARYHAEQEKRFLSRSESMDLFEGHGTTISGGKAAHFRLQQRPELVPKCASPS